MIHTTTMTLQKLHEKYDKENNCLLKKSATQAVYGHGNPKADIIFIGEAPGKKEDETGKPFVGASGKLLDQLLESISLERKDIYITNIVKYRPPENRDPNKKEKVACQEWLTAELKQIKPKVVCTLGRHALNFFAPKAKISESHGELIENKNESINIENIFALYHPAAALFNGSQRPILFEDFKKLPKILKKIT